MEVGPTQCTPGFLLKTYLPVAENSKLAKKVSYQKKKTCQMNECISSAHCDLSRNSWFSRNEITNFLKVYDVLKEEFFLSNHQVQF